jgi:hypothetical protein
MRMAVVLASRVCMQCQQSFQPARMAGKRQKFCSTVCSDAAHRERRRDHTAYPITRQCDLVTCRGTFQVVSGSQKHKRYCSKVCATTAYHRSKGSVPRRRFNIAVERPFTLVHGLAVRPSACPKCGSLRLNQEPVFTRCLTCGGDWPIAGVGLNEQREYERMFGLAAPRGANRYAMPAERGTQGDAHVG